VHNDKLLANFLKLAFGKDGASPDYTFWNGAEEGETLQFSSLEKLEKYTKENDYDEITLSLAFGPEGMESIYGIAWPGIVPLSFHAPTLVLKKSSETISVWLFKKPVPEEDVKYLEDIFNKDIYALCDIPVLGYSA